MYYKSQFLIYIYVMMGIGKGGTKKERAQREMKKKKKEDELETSSGFTDLFPFFALVVLVYWFAYYCKRNVIASIRSINIWNHG